MTAPSWAEKGRRTVFNPFRTKTNEPTAKQRKLLAKITNAGQRQALLGAIANGEDIPTYAWAPLPENLDMGQLAEALKASHESIHTEAAESGRSFEEVLGDKDATWKLSDLIEHLQTLPMDEFGILESPVEATQVLHENDPERSLLMWLYFNPMGPTMMELALWTDSIHGKFIIGASSIHPFSPSITAYGVIAPEIAGNETKLCEVCCHIFEVLGFQGELPLMASLPTSISIPDDSPLDAETTKALVREIAEQTGKIDLERTCNFLREFYCDPWKRTGHELRAAVRTVVDDLDEQPDWEDHFDDWWDLITDPEHVQTELNEFPNAFQGAMQFASGGAR